MKKGNDYFEMMVNAAGLCVKIAKELVDSFDNFDPYKVKEALDRLHKIEHDADGVKHDMMEKLVKEFLPPIEREDLIALGSELDNVTDCIEDVFRKIYMYNVTVLRSDTDRHTAHIVLMSEKLEALMKEFRDYKKSDKIKNMIIEINRLESEGDKIYEDSTRRLFSDNVPPVDTLIWSDIYRRFEHCYDACEHAADVVEIVVMKNS